MQGRAINVNEHGARPAARRRKELAACLALLVVAAVVAPAAAQRQVLARKLENLNVRLTTEHYRLAGTVSDERLAMYGQALEYIYREYERGFKSVLKDYEKRQRAAERKRSKAADRGKAKGRRGAGKGGKSRRAAGTTESPGGSMADADEQDRFPVIVFRQRRQYEEFGRAYLGGSEHTNGMFIPSLNLLLILDLGNFEDTREVLFHEAFHQFLRRYVKDPPIWLNEGLATHYGYARATRRGLTFRNPPDEHWRLVRELIQKKQHLPLWRVVSARRSEFYNSQPVRLGDYENLRVSHVYYAEAYTLVHTLLYDRTGKARLQEYLRELARDDGKRTDEITRKYFGPKACQRITPFWIKHVNSRPETR